MKKCYLTKLGVSEVEALYKRPAIEFNSVFETVKAVLDKVKKDGDVALKEYTKLFDNVELDDFVVSEEEMDEACAKVPEDLKEALKVAAGNIEKFHKEQGECRLEVETMLGVRCFREMRAIEKIGLYIPGGTAPLPSSLLMMAIPAKLAGCEEVVMCTPPGSDGEVPDVTLYAAKLAGVTRIFKIGGAQAIAAMAYGTQSVPKVYKIFGPGNQYVTAAKMLLSVEVEGVAIDMPAGPSEVLVIADGDARADFVAADLLSQAEHGADSQVVLVCTDEAKADEVLAEIEKQLEELPRKEFLEASLDNSFALIVEDVGAAMEFSNGYAPEHLILNVSDSKKWVPEVKNAGSVFLGPYSCESAGDYASGTNHVLPTYGYARMYSGICVDSFVKKITFQEINKEGVKNLSRSVERIAEAEGLEAHKNAMKIRREEVASQQSSSR